MRKSLLRIALSLFSLSRAALEAALFDPPPVPVEAPPAPPEPEPLIEIPILVEPLTLTPTEQLTADLQSSIQTQGVPFPLADWLNGTQLPSFYQTTFHTLLSQEQYFTSINSLDQYNFVVTPYGFDSHFDWGNDNFKLRTFGVAAAMNKSWNSWVLGGGVGYFHSNLSWEGKSHINSVYFGPQVTYQSGRGYLQLMVAGIYNMYEGHSTLAAGETTKNEPTEWDIFSRLEGGYDWETSFFKHGSFFIRPNASLGYFGVLPNGYDEEQADGVSAPVDVDYTDFLNARLALQFWKEFYKKDVGFLIPSFSIGWVTMQPLSQPEVTLSGTEIEAKEYPSSNQLYLGGKLAGVHTKGYLLSIAFDANIGDVYPIYTGTVRFEVDW